MWRYQDHVLNEISEVVEATSKQHDNTQVDIAAAQRAKRKNVHIVFAKTYFSQGAFRFTAKSGFVTYCGYFWMLNLSIFSISAEMAHMRSDR